MASRVSRQTRDDLPRQLLRHAGQGPPHHSHLPCQAPARLWSEATAEWIAGGAIRGKTRRTYRSLLREFGAQANAHCVEDVSEATIAHFLSNMQGTGRSLATCAAYLRTLAAFFRWAQPPDMPITRNLISGWSPYKKRKRARPHYFTDDEYRALLTACDTINVRSAEQRGPLWWKCFIAVLYNAGFRLNETAHLIWRDIEFDRGILRIQPHVGLKGVFEWRPKGKARRAVPVPPAVTDLL